MASGGRRARSGPAPDPLSRTSLVNGREFTVLPVDPGVSAPDFPLSDVSDDELSLWAALWVKPQAFMWDRLGLVFQVAAYARSFVESVEAGASAGLRTAVLRMETELGISTSGMLQNGWVIETPAGGSARPDLPPKGGAKRQTPTGSWLEGVKVEET